jgi:hypothetical protein
LSALNVVVRRQWHPVVGQLGAGDEGRGMLARKAAAFAVDCVEAAGRVVAAH